MITLAARLKKTCKGVRLKTRLLQESRKQNNRLSEGRIGMERKGCRTGGLCRVED